MHNWSTDTRELKKHPEKYAIWHTEQLINYGLGKEKIRSSVLKKYWQQIHIDPDAKKFLQYLLWPNDKKTS